MNYIGKLYKLDPDNIGSLVSEFTDLEIKEQYKATGIISPKVQEKYSKIAYEKIAKRYIR